MPSSDCPAAAEFCQYAGIPDTVRVEYLWGVFAPQYRAAGLLLLNHLPAVVQGSSKVAKLCIGGGSVVKNSDRSF